MDTRQWFRKGMRDGLPVAGGYFAVALTLGLAARNAGLTALQATVTSLLINASAGEFVGFTMIAQSAGYLQAMAMEAIANARYLLMSFALSQKIKPSASVGQRLVLGFDITDELFSLSMGVDGYLVPQYTYGAMLVSIPGWALGTLTGVLLGDIMPPALASAAGVALYGMFIAVFIPPARKNRVVAAVVAVSFAASYLADYFGWLPSSLRLIVLTLGLSLAAALLFPVKTEAGDEK